VGTEGQVSDQDLWSGQRLLLIIRMQTVVHDVLIFLMDTAPVHLIHYITFSANKAERLELTNSSSIVGRRIDPSSFALSGYSHDVE
jgi:hypothetical protein